MSIVETDVEQGIQAGKAHSQLSAQIDAFNEEVDELLQQIERSRHAFTKHLFSQLEKADPARASHCRRVSHYSVDTARELGLGEAEREIIGQAALLHDYGALNAPAAILQKQDALTPEERRTLRLYIYKAAETLSEAHTFNAIAELILTHYEWFSDDGKAAKQVSANNQDVVKLHYGWGSGDGGFPGKLHGQDIPLGARIIAVANAYDALINRRPGHKPVSSQDALIEISGRSGVQYDPDVVDAFIRVV